MERLLTCKINFKEVYQKSNRTFFKNFFFSRLAQSKMTKNDLTADNLTAQLANCIRFLSIDSIEKANSGHPGMPMGMADVATILFSEFLTFNPKQPKWLNRDRFILSAGHGSMLLYSLLYLVGYEDITIDDLKNFRQLHAKCAGHPEYGNLAAVETTTGPLGQGIANAVGMAIASNMLAARIGSNLINHKIYCLAGDGCLMEGISQEAISIAGHLQLKNLILLWDNNSISIDGQTSLTTCENMKMRFEACGFYVIQIDGHNFDDIRKALTMAQKSDRPVLIDCKTIIGFGSPNKAGCQKVHGSPLGAEETQKVRQHLNWPYEPFAIPFNLSQKWLQAGSRSLKTFIRWQADFTRAFAGPKMKELTELNRILDQELTADFFSKLQAFKKEIIAQKPSQATRKSSQIILEFLTAELPELIGGSADLTESVLTKTSHTSAISKNDFSQRYIHYGVREHAMGAIMNGLALYSRFIPFGGTFLVFCDYMKPAIRLAALMKQQVIYILTHDSIGLGEDGPTHQPVEHLAMLRAIPNLNVFRPCDAEETIECFEQALKARKNPSALVLTRQNLPFLSKDNSLCYKGAYIIADIADPDVIIIASGSEVAVAIATREKLKKHQIKARVISIPCFELFEQQDQAYKNSILGADNILKVGIEAAVSQGWDRYLGQNGIFIGMDDFGASAQAGDLFQYFGINAEAACKKIKSVALNTLKDK
jgi:transketolase